VTTAWALDQADDRILRAAFGCYGGTAAARDAAVRVVRRVQTTGRGCWILCDCRPAADRPPALVPVAETHIRRHLQAGWPQHAEACEFFREPAEQAVISASYRPIHRSQVRLVRSFEVGPSAPLQRREAASPANRRPQLARLLIRLLTEAGLQRVDPVASKPPSVGEQLSPLWRAARGLSLDRGVRVADALCMSLAKLPGLMEQITAAPAKAYPRTRPHGLLLIRLNEAAAGKLIALNGQELPVVGRIAVYGERPRDEPGPAESARSPYLALCILARPTPVDPVQVHSAYVHPCASMGRVMLVDSDLERETLSILQAFQWRMARRHRAVVTIEKPMDSLGPAVAEDGTPLPPLIPDFVVTARYRDGKERRVVVETMGYADEGYRGRKRVLHPRMGRAAGAMAVLEHDFHLPGHWQQEWRDNRFKRLLWQSLGPEELAAAEPAAARQPANTIGDAERGAMRTFPT
jgi:hypothetical protein